MPYYPPPSSASSGYAGVPVYVPSGETHTTPENKQEAIAAPTKNDGVWVIDGVRVFL